MGAPMPRLALLALALLLGCSRGAGDALPAPAYGSAPCAGCQAVIAAPRHAAQLLRDDGTVLSFDEPVCLFRALRAEAAPPRAIRFHGEGDQWIDGGDAWFAALPGATTPHGDGWSAFSSFAAAQDAVTGAGSGEILAFAQARERLGQ